jgi:hypothetical protein
MEMIICPICKLSDQTCRVYEAVDNGTTVYETSGVSLAMVESQEATLHHFTTTHESKLVGQLRLPHRPGYYATEFPLHYFAWIIPADIFSINTWLPNTDWSSPLNVILVPLLGLLPAAVLALLVSPITYWMALAIAFPDRKLWERRAQYAMSSGYCYRDNVAFDKKWAQDPVSYIQYVFTLDL